MFNVEPNMFFQAQSSLSDGFDKLQTLKTDISNCTSSYPKGYEYKSEVEEAKSLITTVSSEVSSLIRIVSELKDRLCSLDTGFALAYYSCAAQKYANVTGTLTTEQQAYLEYNQKQYYEQLYKYLDANKDILTAEQKEIYESLKQQKVFEKKYAELEKLYKEKADNNGLLHPIIEGKIDDKIAALEKELGIYQNKWYEDIGYAITQTGSQWKSGVTSLINGEGFEELGNAVKQTVATGAVIYNSARSGVSKIGEYVIDGVVAAGGSLAAGATWLFHDTWSDNDVAGKVMDSTLDFVRRDLVDEQNQDFYENTFIGNFINENSNLKYDSAGAKAIQSTTEFVGKAVLATAATVVSGGAAVPVIIGAAYGVGKGAENYAQSVDRENGEGYNYAEALLRAGVSGAAGAAEFYGYGQMGAAVLGKTVTSNASTSFVKNLFAKDAIVDTGVTVSDHAVNVLFGDETWQDALKYGGIELAFASALNAFGAYQTTKAAKSAMLINDVDLNADMFSLQGFEEFDLSKVHPEVKNTSDLLKDMSDFYEGFGNTYGQDQGAIKYLCDYYYNGVKLNYNQATAMVNDAISKGAPIPHIRKVGTQEYFGLKYNIMAKYGFSERDASIIMSCVDDAGACSYASTCNDIFYKFKDNPQKFEEVFGYSMYKTTKGVTSLNTSDLLLDLYVYANDVKNGGKLIWDDSLNMMCFSTKVDALGRQMPEVVNNQVYMSNGISGRNISCIDSFLKSKDNSLEFQSEVFFNNMNKGLYSDSDYSIIMNCLKDRIANGETATIDYFYNAKNNDQVIRMLSYDKSKYPDTSTALWSEGSGHSTTITGIYDDGITVSSWGNKYFIPKEDLQNGGRFMIMTSNINGIN